MHNEEQELSWLHISQEEDLDTKSARILAFNKAAMKKAEQVELAYQAKEDSDWAVRMEVGE